MDDVQARVQQLFDRYATDGRLVTQDYALLARAIAGVMPQDGSSTDEIVADIVHIMHRIDSNNSGSIEFDEFWYFFLNPDDFAESPKRKSSPSRRLESPTGGSSRIGTLSPFEPMSPKSARSFLQRTCRLEDGEISDKKLAALFGVLDENKGGTVDVGELVGKWVNIRATMKFVFQSSTEEIKAVLSKVDTTGEGELNRTEFVEFIDVCRVLDLQKQGIEATHPMLEDPHSVLEDADDDAAALVAKLEADEAARRLKLNSVKWGSAAAGSRDKPEEEISATEAKMNELMEIAASAEAHTKLLAAQVREQEEAVAAAKAKMAEAQHESSQLSKAKTALSSDVLRPQFVRLFREIDYACSSTVPRQCLEDSLNKLGCKIAAGHWAEELDEAHFVELLQNSFAAHGGDTKHLLMKLQQVPFYGSPKRDKKAELEARQLAAEHRLNAASEEQQQAQHELNLALDGIKTPPKNQEGPPSPKSQITGGPLTTAPSVPSRPATQDEIDNLPKASYFKLNPLFDDPLLHEVVQLEIS